MKRLYNISRKCSDTDYSELMQRKRDYYHKKAQPGRRAECQCDEHAIAVLKSRLSDLDQIWLELQFLKDIVKCAETRHAWAIEARLEEERAKRADAEAYVFLTEPLLP